MNAELKAALYDLLIRCKSKRSVKDATIRTEANVLALWLADEPESVNLNPGSFQKLAASKRKLLR